jgi:predicted amidohydrolase
VDDIQRIGVFHYGKRDQASQGPGSAISQLRAELDKSGDLSNSLLVLPEAFNIDGPYSERADGSKPTHDPSIRRHLSELSKLFKVAFVAGVMDGKQPIRADALPQRYNSALLVDGSTELVLSRKSFDDGIGYVAEAYCQSVTYRGLTITCLICADSFQHNRTNNKECLKRLQARRDQSTGVSILCIPSHLTTQVPPPRCIIDDWKKYFDAVAFSNSAPNHSSGILCDGRYCEGAFSSSENWILLAPLPSRP